MTANGEVDANEEISLYVSGIGANISPTIMESAHDLQSLGKRCVEDGFGFHWEPHSLEPYLVHPTTGLHIRLTVENFCPYLEEDIGAIPTCSPAHNIMAMLTSASHDLTESCIGKTDRVPVAADVVKEIRLEAAAEIPAVDPPPAPHIDVVDTGRRDLKAEATSTAHILRHMPYNKYCETCARRCYAGQHDELRLNRRSCRRSLVILSTRTTSLRTLKRPWA